MNIWGFLGIGVVKSVVSKVLVALGVGFVSYVGFDSLLSTVFDALKGSMNSLPVDALHLLGMSRVDLGLNLIFSAMAARVAMAALKRMNVL